MNIEKLHEQLVILEEEALQALEGVTSMEELQAWRARYIKGKPKPTATDIWCEGETSVAITLAMSQETLEQARELIDRLWEIGEQVDTTTSLGALRELDEERADIEADLADLFMTLLGDASPVEPHVAEE